MVPAAQNFGRREAGELVYEVRPRPRSRFEVHHE